MQVLSLVSMWSENSSPCSSSNRKKLERSHSVSFVLVSQHFSYLAKFPTRQLFRDRIYRTVLSIAGHKSWSSSIIIGRTLKNVLVVFLQHFSVDNRKASTSLVIINFRSNFLKLILSWYKTQGNHESQLSCFAEKKLITVCNSQFYIASFFAIQPCVNNNNKRIWVTAARSHFSIFLYIQQCCQHCKSDVPLNNGSLVHLIFVCPLYIKCFFLFH